MKDTVEYDVKEFCKAVLYIKRCCADEELRRVIIALVNEDAEWEQILRLTAKKLGDIPSIIFTSRYGNLMNNKL